MKIVYFIGIDFGHGETSVSRVPGRNGSKRSRIPLRKTSHVIEEKVLSALCKKNGKWSFVYGKNDFKEEDIREGFKGRIDKLDEKDKESLREFGRLLFQTLLENDSDLKYDPKTGEANFVICIATPSDWRRQNPDSPKEYLEFFRKESGIKPAAMCINESDAAFYSMFEDYSPEDTVFVIDIGSSTIDFTTYHKASCIYDLCWGANLGAHAVEDKLVDYIFDDEENRQNIALAYKLREMAFKAEEKTPKDAIKLNMRLAKEDFYTNKLDYISLETKLVTLVPMLPKKDEQLCEILRETMGDDVDVEKLKDRLRKKFYTFTLFDQVLSKRELEGNVNPCSEEDAADADKGLISEYIHQLDMTFRNAVERLKGKDIVPTRLLLSGGASRMGFVEEHVTAIFKKAFPEIVIKRDTNPEWVVSDGAAEYARTYYAAIRKRDELIEEFVEWGKSNLASVINNAGTVAFNKALRDTLEYKLHYDYVDNSGETSLTDFERVCRKAINQVPYTSMFKDTSRQVFNEDVNGQICSKLIGIIYEQYKKSIEIKDVFIDSDKYHLFDDVTVNTDNLHSHIDTVGYNQFSLFGEDVNWEKTRDSSKRKELADEFIRVYTDAYRYKCESESLIEDFISDAKDKITEILWKNGLFEISE